MNPFQLENFISFQKLRIDNGKYLHANTYILDADSTKCINRWLLFLFLSLSTIYCYLIKKLDAMLRLTNGYQLNELES